MRLRTIGRHDAPGSGSAQAGRRAAAVPGRASPEVPIAATAGSPAGAPDATWPAGSGPTLRIGLTVRAGAAALLLLLPAARPAAAQSLTPAQRQEVVAVMRQALRQDPSILREALAALQAEDSSREAAADDDAVRANRQALDHTAGDPVAGNPQGDVTVVEFYDPRCPYCRAMLPVMDQLVGSDPRVRVVFKDIPILGRGSVLESKALLAAQMQGGDAAYLRLQDVLMHDAAQPTTETLGQDARKAGLDAGRLLTDMGAEAVQARIDANLALAQALHVQGTPALVVGSQMIPGAVELPTLRAAVTAARG